MSTMKRTTKPTRKNTAKRMIKHTMKSPRVSKASFTEPTRDSASHKGQNGKVLVVGGSQFYVGAPALAGLAALRSGCDIVTIAAPEKVAWAINGMSPDLMTCKLDGEIVTLDNYSAIAKLVEKHDVLLFGNGMGVDKNTTRLCKKLAALPLLKVIDADAIKVISVTDPISAILTPNKNELRIFLGNSGVAYTEDPATLQRTLAGFFAKGNCLLIKGPTDVIIGKDFIARNTTGNAGMTRGGTGDVLSGLAAGYLAQTKDQFHAASNAAYMNGVVGDILAKKKKGFTYLASDMVEELRRIRL